MSAFTGSLRGHRSRSTRRWAACAVAAAGLAASAPAGATHLYSHVVHQRVPDPIGAPSTVEITVDIGFRADYGALDPMTLTFGDGTSSVVPGMLVGSPALAAGNAGYEVTRHVVQHTYPGPGIYTASWSGCCLSSEPINGNDVGLGFGLTVQLPPAGKGGAIVSVPPVIHLQTGGSRTYRILARDHDGDPIHCRPPTAAESTLAQDPPQIPGGAAPVLSDDPEGCLITWDTTAGLAGQTFTLGVAFESGPAAQKTVSLASILVRLQSAPPPTCDGEGIFTIDLGQSSVLPFTGQSTGAGDLTLGSIGMFGMLTPADGTVAASPFTAQNAVTPVTGDEGLHALNVVFRDAQNVTADCPVILDVASCPSFGMPCSAGTGACEATGYLACNGAQVTCSAVPGVPSPEVCNGIDDDCNGAVDDGCIGGTGGTGGQGTGGQGASGGQGTGGQAGAGGQGAGGQAGAGGQGASGGQAGAGGQGASGGQAGAGGQGASGGQGGAGGQGASGGQGSGGQGGSASSAGAGGGGTGGGDESSETPIIGCACRTAEGSGGGRGIPPGALLGALILGLRRRRR